MLRSGPATITVEDGDSSSGGEGEVGANGGEAGVKQANKKKRKKKKSGNVQQPPQERKLDKSPQLDIFQVRYTHTHTQLLFVGMRVYLNGCFQVVIMYTLSSVSIISLCPCVNVILFTVQYAKQSPVRPVLNRKETKTSIKARKSIEY